MSGDDAVDIYGIGLLQLAAGQLPAFVQVGRLDGRRVGLLLDFDTGSHRH